MKLWCFNFEFIVAIKSGDFAELGYFYEDKIASANSEIGKTCISC